MSYLVDTNILLRSVQETHSMHEVAVQAVKSLFEQSEMLCILPQNLIEFWVVATRPIAMNGLLLHHQL
jgi:predicted nucleic-acid-binding protein